MLCINIFLTFAAVVVSLCAANVSFGCFYCFSILHLLLLTAVVVVSQ